MPEFQSFAGRSVTNLGFDYGTDLELIEGENLMAIEQHKIIVTRLFKELWLQGNLSIVDELVADDYVLHHCLFPSGCQGLKQAVAMMRDTFPAFGGRVDDLITEGDRVACRWVRYSLHEGEFMDTPATGQEVTIKGISIYRLVDYKVVEEWLEIDLFDLLRQIGAITMPK
jgi:predicted ester cyclase